MDSSGSSGAVAMNGAVGVPTGAPSGIGMAQPLPDLGDPNAESSSSGCSLPAGGSSGVGLGVFGLLALLGLGRSRRR
jgi:MYXO-CTERM domain-containing protein